MDRHDPADPSVWHNRKQAEGPGTVTFTAPLGSAESGRLVFASGAAEVALYGDPALAALYSARFERERPGIAVHDGVVAIQYRLTGTPDRWHDRRDAPAEVTLNGSIPWEIEFRCGVSRLTADLDAVRLRSLDLASVGLARIALPQPGGVAYIHFAGSAGEVIIYRPAGVAVQLKLDGSGARLTLDGRRFRAAAEGLLWISADDAERRGRYEITLAGSVSALTLATR